MTMMSQLALLEHPATSELLTESGGVVAVHLAVVGREGISGSRCGSTDEGISRILQRLVTKADKSFDIHWPGHQHRGIS